MSYNGEDTDDDDIETTMSRLKKLRGVTSRFFANLRKRYSDMFERSHIYLRITDVCRRFSDISAILGSTGLYTYTSHHSFYYTADNSDSEKNLTRWHRSLPRRTRFRNNSIATIDIVIRVPCQSIDLIHYYSFIIETLMRFKTALELLERLISLYFVHIDNAARTPFSTHISVSIQPIQPSLEIVRYDVPSGPSIRKNTDDSHDLYSGETSPEPFRPVGDLPSVSVCYRENLNHFRSKPTMTYREMICL